MKYKKLISVFLLAFFLTSFVLAQNKPVHRYKAYMPVPVRSLPDQDSRSVGTLVSGTIVEALEKNNYWIKVKIGSLEGWVATTMMERVKVPPYLPELVFNGGNYKIINGVYTYYFAVRNDGLASYSGKIALHLFVKDKIVATNVYSFDDNPIDMDGGRMINIDIPFPVDKFQFESDSDKFENKTGKLVEVINDR